MNKKIIVLIVILLVILGLGIGGYFAVKKAIQLGKEKGGEFLNELSPKESEQPGEEGEQPAGESEQSGKESGNYENNPITYKNIEDISQKEMVEYCQKQANEMMLETPMYLKDACFYQIAIHFRNSELCNHIEVADSKRECLEKEKAFSEKWNAMQGKIGKMDEALCVEITAQAQCHAFEGMSDLKAYQKWLDEWPEWLNNEFGVTAEEYKLYSEVMSQNNDPLGAMNLSMRVLDRVDEICPD